MTAGPEGGDLLAGAPLELVGRIMPASNQTFLCTLGVDGPRAVYKPVRGERPLWDFPEGSLAGREYAAWLVSDALGWDVVPPTVLRNGPHGSGMVQIWQEPDPGQVPVDVVAPGAVPQGYLEVLEALDASDRPVLLVHEDTPALRRMAVFDVVVNNTDRKGGHVLAMPGGHRYGVDHGVCFHVEDKLRTVLWGWAGEALTAQEREGLERVLGREDLTESLEGLLSVLEIEAFHRRCAELLAGGVLPGPGAWPAIPWPPF